MFFPFENVKDELDEDLRDEMIRKILDEIPKDDPPFLSVVLVHSDENWSVHLTEILGSGDYDFVWKIKALRGEFGEDMRPGDEVVRVLPHNRVKRNGDLITPRELNLAKHDGSYERKYEKRNVYILDEKGCFTCGYSDASYFLNNWGYNLKTRSAVTKKEEYSYEPVDLRDSSKGQKKHVRYWRYAEMDKADYAKLPVLNASEKPQQVKGR